MWKSKACPAVIILIFFCVLSYGCLSIEPTYTKEKIVESITGLCKQEYNISPKVWLLGETVWIYLPLPRLVTKDIQWDSEMLQKINKVMMGSSRVVLSMKPRPQFMVIVASDTQEFGLDYITVSWIPDIVKYQLEFISRDEFSRRNVMRVMENTLAIGDTEGNHIERTELKIGEFLAWQIAQRIQEKFSTDLKFKDYLKTGAINSDFKEGVFRLNITVEKIKTSPHRIDIQKEIAKIVAFVIREYDFKEFITVEIENTVSGEKSVLSRLALKDYLSKKVF